MSPGRDAQSATYESRTRRDSHHGSFSQRRGQKHHTSAITIGVPKVEIRAEAFDAFWGDPRDDDVFTLAQLLARNGSSSSLLHHHDASVSSPRRPLPTGAVEYGGRVLYSKSRRSRSYPRMYATVR